jgi:hypothetical protein
MGTGLHCGETREPQEWAQFDLSMLLEKVIATCYLLIVDQSSYNIPAVL